MKLLTIVCVLFLSACSVNIVEMTPEPTIQNFDLTDNESDGVIAARDNCPETYTGAQVNNNGCGTESKITIRRELEVNFETDSFVVEDKYMSEIDKLASFMVEYPDTKVTVEGHTSIRGTAEYNQTLSQQRADAIKDILMTNYGISSRRINAVGFGFDSLLLEGDDEYIHARNRRIVAEIIKDKSFIDMKWTIYSVDEVE